MRKGKRSLVLMLVAAMVLTSVPVSAAPMRASSYTSSWFGNFWNNLFNWSWNNKNWNNNSSVVKNDTAVEEPETEASEEQEVEKELVVEEDTTTVENGELLRASTYSLRTADASETAETYAVATAAEEDSTEAAADSTTVKYFPVTMYDYDTDALNVATDEADTNGLTVREGIYFTGGSPNYEKTTATDLSAFVEGQYYIQNIRASANNVESWLYSVADDTSIRGTTAQSDATLWTLVVEEGEYYLMSGDKYLVVGTDGDTDGLTDTKTPITISAFSGNVSGVQLSQNGYYLCQWGSETSIYYGGYNVSNDDGNGLLFYPVNDGAVSDTPITPLTGETYISSGYEEWNRWDKATGDNSNGDLIYTGLVQNSLVDDQIVFNVNEGGIFSYDASEVVGTDGSIPEITNRVKRVYEYIGLPFVWDAGKYTFDSDVNGAYFADTDNDGSPDLKSGTSTSAYNLYFAENSPQPMPTDLSVGDGSSNAWFPFNSESSYTKSQVNYHMGMRADIPFSMTPNGRIKSTDDNSDAITFTFSGDDDVWVFIDGDLVIDLGGIHNRLDVTIDFAANTVTYSEENAQDANTLTGSYNDSDFATTQKLFTDSEGVGLINSTRDAFAAEENHEMSVFYLERGEGTSNCKIEFNLPMMDSVIVTKQATESWSQAAENADLEVNPDNPEAGVDVLPSNEQAIVDKINFGFVLYKKDSEGTSSPVANTKYYLLDAAGTVINIPSTDANGHFYLKNGQSAKFITEIPEEGVTYYVIEETIPEGFITPDYQFDGEAVGGFSYINEAGDTVEVTSGADIPEQIIPTDETVYKSYEVTVKGSVEANDSVEFKCRNYLDAELPNPTALAYEDIIVIDYGLPVQIDPLENDVFRGEDIEIVYVGGADVTLTETIDEAGVRSAAWTTDDILDSGTVVKNDVTYAANGDEITRDTLTYTLNKQLTDVEEITYIVRTTGKEIQESTGIERTQNDYSIGKIYIVPATVMYYEENFNGLVTFTPQIEDDVTGWKGEVKNDTYVSGYQEPGVVGNNYDSTYGSDVAYLSDSEDSNGTSYKGLTGKGAIRFSYTFTGTGTSFFARTSDTTGYMQVKLYEGEKTSGTDHINLTYRDTYYNDTNDTEEDSTGTLYNIPVYTESGLDYGTYTVVVTVAKAGTPTGTEGGSGNEFYLDGIRVMQPLNEDNDASAGKLSYMEVEGSSEDKTETGIDKSPKNVGDGDPTTFWATDPDSTLENAYFIAKLDDVYTIEQVDYTERKYGESYDCTGNLDDYIIEVSTDGENWVQVASGATSVGTTEIKFNAVEAKFVKLRATESYHWQENNKNTVMTIGDLAIYGTKNTETLTDKALGAYATDGEANMEVITIRQKLITDAENNETPWNFAVLTDTNGEIITADEYVSIGPKEEVYLNAGQTVSFSLKYWDLDALKLYMGMKAPFGTAKVQVGQTTQNLANATDCYYDVTENYSSLVTKYEEIDGVSVPYFVATYTFTATEDIVSLTNIKVVGNYEFEIVENEDVDIEGSAGEQ